MALDLSFHCHEYMWLDSNKDWHFNLAAILDVNGLPGDEDTRERYRAARTPSVWCLR